LAALIAKPAFADAGVLNRSYLEILLLHLLSWNVIAIGYGLHHFLEVLHADGKSAK
jgi:hypothetical protein